MRPSLLLASCLLLMVRLVAAEPTALERLATSLTGTFSSADQARGDQNVHAVTLHVARIWTDRSDGPWLYAEQALSDATDHPYRQRLYQLTAKDNGMFLIRVFDPPDLIAVTGAWKDSARLGQLNPAALTAQEGCVLILHVQPDGTFQGGTEGRGCPNAQRGAGYATSEITVRTGETILWERGYTAAGTQVWGLPNGGYIFKRVE